MVNIGVLGAGSWGTALASILSSKGYHVKLWGRSKTVCNNINKFHKNEKYLSDTELPIKLRASTDLKEVLDGVKVVVLSVPSHTIREIISQIKGFVNQDTIIINTAKGFEVKTTKRLSEVIISELPMLKDNLVALSGPSHAEEVVKGLPTAIVAAASKRETAEYAQDLFMTPKFRVYTNPDIIGVELGGALKNVIALGTGISDGLGFGDNTKSAIITRGLAEIGRLGVAMGANPLTFAGLSGVGDLVVTCTSQHSRNRRAGIALGKGKSLDETLEEVGMVVEGVKTTAAAYKLSQEHKIEMPIVEQIHQVLFEGQSPEEGVSNLMERVRTEEVENIALNNSDLWEK